MKPSYFDGPEWHAVTASSIAAGSIFPAGPGDTSWTLFRRGPILAAYPRFPVGLREAPPAAQGPAPEECERLKQAGVDLLRMSAPLQGLGGGFAGVDLPETRLHGLQEWDADSLGAGMRRKFAAGRKAGLSIQHVAPDDGSLLHQLYLGTLARRGANLRYPIGYFDRICRIPRGPLHAVKVLDSAGLAIGFVVYVLDGDTGVYLHGGYSQAAASARPGYFAMRAALEHCRSHGAVEFNFLVSPSKQMSLVEFKESFGGRTTMRRHWQQSLTIKGRMASAILSLAAR